MYDSKTQKNVNGIFKQDSDLVDYLKTHSRQITNLIVAQPELRKLQSQIISDSIESDPQSVASLVDAMPAPTKPSSFRRGYLLDELDSLCKNQWIIKRIIPDGLNYLYGDTGTYKSFIALSWAIHVAMNIEWFGYKIKNPGAVVYIYSEGTIGIKNRVDGWFKHHGLERPKNLLILPYTYDLASEQSQKEIIQAVKDRLGDQSIAFFIIDTFNQNKVGSENSDETVAAFIKGCRLIRENLNKCAILAIHHCGKDAARGMRGHSSLKADVDGVIEATSAEGSEAVILDCRKTKDAEKFKPITLRGQEIDLGVDEDNEPVTTLVFASDKFTVDDLGEVESKVLRAIVNKWKTGYWLHNDAATLIKDMELLKPTKFQQVREKVFQKHGFVVHESGKGFRVSDDIAIKFTLIGG